MRVSTLFVVSCVLMFFVTSHAKAQVVSDPSSDVRDPRAAPARDLFLVHDSIRQLASDDQGVPDQATKDTGYVLHMVVHAYHSNIIQDFVCVYLRSMTQYVRSDFAAEDQKGGIVRWFAGVCGPDGSKKCLADMKEYPRCDCRDDHFPTGHYCMCFHH
ncbi:unnamed protein product [Brassica oleracea]|uniref:Secreted protein n=1 Tax=Brassica oleracea TaxID=3712 RepID=A0A3P6EBU4_BRAOL|nr:unnamed protein product [Brassica oleracea]